MSRRVAAFRGRLKVMSGGKSGGRAITLVLLLTASAVPLSWWAARRGPNPRLASILTLTTQQPAPTPKLTKEYIYAGGRLMAIEEMTAQPAPSPPPPSPGPAPAGLLATASVSAVGGHSVTVTWSPPAGQVAHYEVERTVSLADQSPFIFNCNGPPCVDPSALASKAYLYRVRAVFTGGGASEYSNHDLAITFPFMDNPLNADGTKTIIKAQHFTELREAVNAVRVTAGLLPFNWSGTPQQALGPQSRGLIYASHFNDLRSGLGEALGRLGLPTPQSAQVSVGDVVAYEAVQELRTLMR